MVTVPLLPLDQIIDLYPALSQVQPTLAEIGAALQPYQVPTDTVLFAENTACQGFPLVIEGEIKVSRNSGDGRSLELYRVVPGELCLTSSAALFRDQVMSACGVTTKPSHFLLIKPDLFNRWIDTPAFRNAVLGLFAERMADLTGLIDAVAFHKLDRRLAAALLGRGQQLNLTHQTLADELGTVREIVTRLLRRFEREGWVVLGREQIQIVNSVALRALVSGSSI
ncbi:MAG TPA: Crp/Fnr family transcriptional regulator [Rhodoferax sp.]|nr:Crp/Fnr family transcriptional regulator [Rhodoferax sp.]